MGRLRIVNLPNELLLKICGNLRDDANITGDITHLNNFKKANLSTGCNWAASEGLKKTGINRHPGLLVYAVEHRKVELVKALLENGADPNGTYQPSQDWMTPWCDLYRTRPPYPRYWQPTDEESFQMYYWEPEYHLTAIPLTPATTEDSIEEIQRELLAHRSVTLDDINDQSFVKLWVPDYPNLRLIELVKLEYPKYFRLPNVPRLCPIIMAILTGHLEILDLLIAAGARLDIQSWDPNFVDIELSHIGTDYMYVQTGHERALKARRTFLFGNDNWSTQGGFKLATIDLNEPNLLTDEQRAAIRSLRAGFYTPVDFALYHDQVQVFSRLLEHAESAADAAALDSEKTSEQDILDSNIFCQDRYKYLLHRAISMSRNHVTRYLIERDHQVHKLNLGLIDPLGLDPLYLANEHVDTVTMQLLVKRGPEACGSGLDDYGVNMTGLMRCCLEVCNDQSLSLGFVEVLLQAGADPNFEFELNPKGGTNVFDQPSPNNHLRLPAGQLGRFYDWQWGKKICGESGNYMVRALDMVVACLILKPSRDWCVGNSLVELVKLLLDHGAALDSASGSSSGGAGRVAEHTYGQADAMLLAAGYHVEPVLKAFISHSTFLDYAKRNGVDVILDVIRSVPPEYSRDCLVEEVESMLVEKGLLDTVN